MPVKTETRQTVLMQHRTRDFLVRQLTQLAVAPQVRFQRNAIRAHAGESGLVVPKGVQNMGRLTAEADAARLPPEARAPLDLLAEQFRDTKARIDTITASIKAAAGGDETARRLQV